MRYSSDRSLVPRGAMPTVAHATVRAPFESLAMSRLQHAQWSPFAGIDVGQGPLRGFKQVIYSKCVSFYRTIRQWKLGWLAAIRPASDRTVVKHALGCRLEIGSTRSLSPMRFAWTLQLPAVLAVVACFTAVRPAVSQSFLDRVEQRTRETVVTPVGKSRGFLGLRADDFGQQGRGVRVTLVHPGGAADRAGVAVDDLVLAVGQQPVFDLDSLSSVLESKTAGDRVKLQIKRDDQRLDVEVTLAPRLAAGGPGNQPSGVPESVPPPSPAAASARPRATLGVTAESLTDSGKRKRGVQRGVLVTAVHKGSAAERCGLKVDAVILSADGVDLQRAADLEQLVQQSRPGDSLQLLWRFGQEYLRREVILLPGPVVRRPRLGGGVTTTDAPARRREELPQQHGVLPGARRPVAGDVRRADPESLRLQLQALMIELRDLQRRLKEVERQLQEVSPVPESPRAAPQLLPPPVDS